MQLGRRIEEEWDADPLVSTVAVSVAWVSGRLLESRPAMLPNPPVCAFQWYRKCNDDIESPV